MPKTYSHPALARFLREHGACPERAREAREFAAQHPTLVAAVAASKDAVGKTRVYWLAARGDGDAADRASDLAGRAAHVAADRGGNYGTTYWRVLRPAVRKIAVATALRLDASEARGRNIAAGRRRAARARLNASR